MAAKVFLGLFLMSYVLVASAPLLLAAPGDQVGDRDYILRAGDTLSELAAIHLGDRSAYPAIVVLTNQKALADETYATIADPASVEPGWKIYLPSPDEVQAFLSTPQTLRLATTTSTYDSGLLDAILPDFQQHFNAQVDVIAVGTGQALAMGGKGDVDVVLVHARSSEDEFVADGDGFNRLDVMYNDFIVVGPQADPAGIADVSTARAAFAKIATSAATFVSRGDNSGTYTKEKAIWASAGITPTNESCWYLSIGQGMGETLSFANEKLAYTLTDRGTWLAQQANLPNLTILVGGISTDQNSDRDLLNPYGVIPVNPAKHSGVNYPLAMQFARWLTCPRVQGMIMAFGKDRCGQSLFYPASEIVSHRTQ